MINRCAQCVMPETEGHITLDDKGICNICNRHLHHHQPGASPVQGGLAELKKKIYEVTTGAGNSPNALVALSGGKDSTMALYVAVKELGLQPLVVFIDNGFCTDAMYRNVKNAAEKLGVDLIIYAPQLIKNLFKHLLLSKSQVYYCRICNALIDYYVRSMARQHGIPLLITGLTKGQEFLKGTELFWIYRSSDANLLQAVAGRAEFSLITEMFTSLALYFHRQFSVITAVSPFHYLAYEEQEILKVLTEELGYLLPGISWPQGSTNCLFNFVSQSLTVGYFGYSQHEAEISALVRNNEMPRERALEIIDTPISEEQMNLALARLHLTCKDIL